MLRKLAAILIPTVFLAGAVLTHGVLAWLCLAIWVLSSAVVMMGLLRPRSQMFGKTLFQTAPQPRVALTFDDGPHPEDTPAILEILEKEKARATFFFVGCKARQHPDLVRRVVDAGHEVAAHSDTHPWWFSLARKRRLRREVGDCAATLCSLSGARPRFFRPPVGHKALSLEDVLREEGLEMVAWTVRAYDTLSLSAETIQARLLARAKPGGILLLHEGLSRREGSPSNSVRALRGVLRGLRERGLEPVTLRQLVGERP
ncbi:MAG TPA: polysaccharide deacetylase family protein [Candidatus Polarisedimenticolia bacterium]|jgi:peptidoglycan/xylan/chitin deacetylase (PgdA/CDA1 family)|nr:polysaccharide deacetylase family protein [Candidatus Polarisedimenticolia bacterium]